MNKENAVTERLVNKVTYLDATKFALLGVFTPMEIICPKIWAKSQPRMQKGHMRLTRVDQKGPCVSSTQNLTASGVCKRVRISLQTHKRLRPHESNRQRIVS